MFSLDLPLRLIACFRFAWCLYLFQSFLSQQKKISIFKGKCALVSVLTLLTAGSRSAPSSSVWSCRWFVSSQVLSSHPGNRHSRSKESRLLTGRSEGLHSYDSGNDTFSPPSSKSAISPASATEGKRSRCKHLDSPEKLKITDNVSDSGNSVTSYDFLCKSYREDGFPATVFNKR